MGAAISSRIIVSPVVMATFVEIMDLPEGSIMSAVPLTGSEELIDTVTVSRLPSPSGENSVGSALTDIWGGVLSTSSSLSSSTLLPALSVKEMLIRYMPSGTGSPDAGFNPSSTINDVVSSEVLVRSVRPSGSRIIPSQVTISLDFMWTSALSWVPSPFGEKMGFLT